MFNTIQPLQWTSPPISPPTTLLWRGWRKESGVRCGTPRGTYMDLYRKCVAKCWFSLITHVFYVCDVEFLVRAASRPSEHAQRKSLTNTDIKPLPSQLSSLSFSLSDISLSFTVLKFSHCQCSLSLSILIKCLSFSPTHQCLSLHRL